MELGSKVRVSPDGRRVPRRLVWVEKGSEGKTLHKVVADFSRFEKGNRGSGSRRGTSGHGAKERCRQEERRGSDGHRGFQGKRDVEEQQG